MDCNSTRIPYQQTNSFTDIVLDYIEQKESLRPFFSFKPDIEGIKKAIDVRSKYKTNRQSLVSHLLAQYSNVKKHGAVDSNIELLSESNTFTITTAHQPNLFTGPLYFIYKILHVIKLAEELTIGIPGKKFVPVFYMGSEDADLDELGHFYINGEKYTWDTKQNGAVGRMKVDKELIKVLSSVKGQLAVMPFGNEMIGMLEKCYKEGVMIQDATFRLVHELFGKYGLIVLIADSAELKKQAISLFESDITDQKPSELVEESIRKLEKAGYKAQAQPRDINLFYLEDGKRERIVKTGDKYRYDSKTVSKEELISELHSHPERFSPNVILRSIYQEMILPNIVFIGGGGELAYWLQYRSLFEHYKVPFPVLVLRNSFLILEKKWIERMAKLELKLDDVFASSENLVNRMVERESVNKIKLNGAFEAADEFYEKLKKQTEPIDVSLVKHIDSLKARSIHNLKELQKKMLRAEKRKFADQTRQIHTLKEKLFPKNGLQERVDNFMMYYAKWGSDFIDKLLKNSSGLEQEFAILTEK